MNILIHHDQAAQRADASGFHYFAAAIRKLLVQEIERADRKTFMEWVLGVPHNITPDWPPHEYLERADRLAGCGCSPERICIPNSVLHKVTAPYTMFGKLSSNPKFSLREIPPRT